MKTQVGTTFQAAAAEALQQSSEGFLRLASERLGSLQQQGAGDLEARQQAIASLLGPLRQSLDKMDQHARDLERARGLALGELREQLRAVAEGQDRLRAETGNLVNALAAPAVRGRWGEIQLRRVLEVAGMQDHCDFETQPTLSGPEGRLRPDVVVNLPGGRRIAVDAKAPMGAFLDALATADDGDRRAHLRQHAEQVRAHLEKLSAKNYWDGLGASLELVVMFLPGDALYQAALEQAPGLVEEALSHRVVIATPMTLIGVLRAVHAAWREENLAANAEELGRCGRELHERIATMAEHLDGMGGALHRTVEAFNRTVGSFESRVLPGARRIAELGSAGKKALPNLQPVDLRPRSASASVIPVGTREARGERARALSVAAAAATQDAERDMRDPSPRAQVGIESAESSPSARTPTPSTMARASAAPRSAARSRDVRRATRTRASSPKLSAVRDLRLAVASRSARPALNQDRAAAAACSGVRSRCGSASIS